MRTTNTDHVTGKGSGQSVFTDFLADILIHTCFTSFFTPRALMTMQERSSFSTGDESTANNRLLNRFLRRLSSRFGYRSSVRSRTRSIVDHCTDSYVDERTDSDSRIDSDIGDDLALDGFGIAWRQDARWRRATPLGALQR